MPNWCEGTLKVRGTIDNIKRFLKEGIQTVNFFGNETEGLKINTDEELNLWYSLSDDAWIKGTQRNFIESADVEIYIEEKEETKTLAIGFKAAWGIEHEPYIEISKKFNIDIRIYGFERGMEFNQEIIIEKGELIKNEEIKFADYEWECPMPLIGG